MSKAAGTKAKKGGAGNWRPVKIERVMDMGGSWSANGKAVSAARRGRISRVKDGMERLEQTNALGLSNMTVHLPYAAFRISFDMRLVKGQEAKFNLTAAATDTATRLDFFGAHRPGAVRLSVEDSPWSESREFDLSGIDFMRGCRVEIASGAGVLELRLSTRAKSWKKRYATGKSFSGVFGFGTYRGAARFSDIKVETRDEDFRALAMKQVYLGCTRSCDLEALCAAVVGLRGLDFEDGRVAALSPRPVLFAASGAAEGGLDWPAATDLCVFFAESASGLGFGMGACAGAALKAGRRVCAVFSGAGAKKNAQRASGWGIEAYALGRSQSAAELLGDVLKREL